MPATDRPLSTVASLIVLAAAGVAVVLSPQLLVTLGIAIALLVAMLALVTLPTVVVAVVLTPWTRRPRRLRRRVRSLARA